ncbi:caspase family protein [Actinoplanes oblitus]|uniref:Caspase family protein n=1 Tax=Actinoplanes oblitus TaxID=3040509 RepID=A0ABY8WRI0_9ACTN|nr:caspase family protein [Actinoplanes oblitus]WIN00465.1 caspase family protein [Actinoplanes oblitus]
MVRRPRRALLIGVSEYDDSSIDSLRFIDDDLDDLGEALTSVGYEVVRHPRQQNDRDRIDTAIEQFCRQAESGQQLLIFVSGHGIHRDGRDFLLPSSADTTSRKFTEKCLEIEFDGHIESTRCGDVLVVVDACREGVRLQEKSGYSYVHSWGQQQRKRSAARTIAYLYACSSGEYAHWRKTADGTFSLFTRAFSRALTDPSVPGTLTGVREAVQVRLETFSAELGVPLQKPHLDGDGDRCARLVLVDRTVPVLVSRGAAGWADYARTHAVWDLVHAKPGAPELPESAAGLRDATVECVETWSREYRRLRESLNDDPWWDEELASRMHDRLSWMIKHLLNRGKLAEADKPPLSPAEAAVLVLMPFAQQLHRASAAVAYRSVLDEPDPADDRCAEFARYVEGRSRIRRRLRRLVADGDQAHASTIRWAAYHRWLAQRAQLYRTEVIAESLLAPLAPPGNQSASLLRDVASAERLARLLRALRSDPEAAGSGDPALDALGGTDIPAGAQTVAGGSPDEQTVRDRLLALILLVAEEFTIDATALPSMVTDHIGLNDGIEPVEVLRAVQGARWSARGRTRVLEAQCPHQAVELALAEHTNGIAEVLRRVDAAAEADRTLEALRDLPTHVAADGLRPLPGPDGQPRYDMVGFRFRLDDDQVQELLMGEQLYGDPALAIRELYQNALDACRYRRARTQHLRKQGRWTADWDGQIAFTQGVDERGRAWLECRDNGIGMSERELGSVFSHAGARFADLPEFLEERAVWDKEDIEFHPNSRFGIGVLSYFMLGDEIEVTTARFSRDGSIAARLRVDIDGPGSLCRIRTVDAGSAESGTTIRVYLRPDISVSCTNLLSRLLWVAEFPVTASDGATTLTWEPGELSPYAPAGGDRVIGRSRDYGYERSARILDQVLPSTTAHVWWCKGPGGILADGLWAGNAPFGYVVNLVGPKVPRLTVDRRRILSMDESHVERLLRGSLDDLFAENGRLLTLDWLSRVADKYLGLADEIAERMIDRGIELAVGYGITIKTALVGVFPTDRLLFSTDVPSRATDTFDDALPESERLSVGRWRLYQYLRAGCVAGVRLATAQPAVAPARPSDVWVLSLGTQGPHPWPDPARPVPVRHVLTAAARLGWPIRRVVERLIELGLSAAEFDWPDCTLGTDDARLLAEYPAGQDDLTRPAPPGCVSVAAMRLGWSPRRVAERLAEMGLPVPDLAWPATALGDDDAELLPIRRVGIAPWLDPAQPAPIRHVFVAAARSRKSPRQVARRMTELGLFVPEVDWPDVVLGNDDVQLLPREPIGQESWLDPARPAPIRHVFLAAARLRTSPRQVAQRLTEIGLPVSDFAWPSLVMNNADARLLPQDSDSTFPWFELDEPALPGYISVAAARVEWSPRRAAERLTELGLPVPAGDWPDRALSIDDARLLSLDLDGRGPWLDPVEPAPPGRVSVAAARLGWSPRRVAERLMELGLSVSGSDWPETLLSNDDCRLLSQDLDGESPWLDPEVPAPPGRVSVAAARLGWSPRRVAERLMELGLSVSGSDWPAGPLSNDDARLLSEGFDGEGPWLDPEQPVSIGHVFVAAAILRRSPQQAALRLLELGLGVPDFAWPDVTVGDDDRAFFGGMLAGDEDDQEELENALRSPVNPGVLLPGVNGGRWSIGRVALRLRHLGFRLPEEIEVVPAELPRTDRLRRALD